MALQYLQWGFNGVYLLGISWAGRNTICHHRLVVKKRHPTLLKNQPVGKGHVFVTRMYSVWYHLQHALYHWNSSLLLLL
jgi:hypothetical protein